MATKYLHLETLALHVGQETPDPATDSRAVPIYQTTSYVFRNSQHAADRFGLRDAGNIYGRLTNSTQDVFEKRIAALEGGVAALAVASGAAAVTYALQNVLSAGDHIVAADNLYGGSFNLITHTLATQGISNTIVTVNDLDALEKAIRPNTKVIYAETLGNPNSDVTDLDAIAEIAHKHGIVFIVDNTFAPLLIRPIEHGADIVVHSATKFIGGHGSSLGGVIVDSGKFDWSKGNFPGLTEPDESYHGIIYTDVYGDMAYIVKARMQLMRDFGMYPAAHSAFLLNLGLETLDVRMKQYCVNAMKVAEYLKDNDMVESITYPGLEGDEGYELGKKYLKGCSGVISFVMKGGKETAMHFMDSLKLASNEVHVADIRTCVLHPASETHRQLTDEQLLAAGIEGGMIRLSVGLEDVDDIIADLEQAFEKIR